MRYQNWIDRVGRFRVLWAMASWDLRHFFLSSPKYDFGGWAVLNGNAAFEAPEARCRKKVVKLSTIHFNFN